jgi:biopolymer transport protein ExbD
MLASKPNLLTFAVIAVLTCNAASAAETQRWSVHIVDDTAVLRVDPNTEARFVQSAISGLQHSGIENFSLRAANPETTNDATQLSYSIVIVERTAEIDATHDLPYKYLIAAIDKLKDQGITRMKFVPSKTTSADAVPQ